MSDGPLATLVKRIDALSRREKFMVLGVLVLLPWLVANKFIARPLLLERVRLVEGSKVLAKSIQDLTAQRQRLQNSRRDAKTEEDVRLGGYRKELATLEGDVAKAMGKLVAPQEMTLALETLLRNTPGVTLTDLESLPAQAIIVNPQKDPTIPGIDKGTLPTEANQDKNKADKSKNQPKSPDKSKTNTKPATEGEKAHEEPPLVIWRHALKLTFTGDYVSTMSLLQSLRGMPWTFYWDTLDLVIKNHPQAQVTLILYTLSLDEELIGA
ncbi:MAG: hypothetical protein HQL66_06940 [Magnetococcales bacterium]|nr:hypothetical protein [Magnetococcales bacterium]